jgi:acyl-CoA synthetase (AMP-forming)/AMP-acid ligase II
MVSHEAIRNRLLWMQEQYALTPEDRVLQKTPFSFDVSVWEFFWPLLAGARMVLAVPEGHKDLRYLAGLIREQRVTTLHFVPSMLDVFLEEPTTVDCDSVRRVFASGEALPAELAARLTRAWTPTATAATCSRKPTISGCERKALPRNRWRRCHTAGLRSPRPARWLLPTIQAADTWICLLGGGICRGSIPPMPIPGCSET